MSETTGGHLKAKKAVTVPTNEGQHVALRPGEPIAKDRLADHFTERLGKDEYLDGLVEDASQEDVDNWNAGLPSEEEKDFDRNRLNQFEGVVLPGPDQQAQLVDGDTIIKDRDPEPRFGNEMTTPARTPVGVPVDPDHADQVAHHVKRNEGGESKGKDTSKAKEHTKAAGQASDEDVKDPNA